MLVVQNPLHYLSYVSVLLSHLTLHLPQLLFILTALPTRISVLAVRLDPIRSIQGGVAAAAMFVFCFFDFFSVVIYMVVLLDHYKQGAMPIIRLPKSGGRSLG